MLILADSAAVRQVVCASADFEWIDLTAPDRPALAAIAKESSLDDSAVEDCLDNHQLPKLEQHGSTTFIILRLHVGPVSESVATADGLTTPVTIVMSPRRLVTIHRRDHPVFARLRRQYSGRTPLDDSSLTLLGEIIRDCILSFEAPLVQLGTEIQQFEESVLSTQLSERALEQIFVRKRRASVISWMLLRIHDALRRAPSHALPSPSMIGEWRELTDTLHARAREIQEHTDNLLNLHIAVASHRTNQVMRVLTVVSVIFMPLTFIVGAYGMNFDAPEFKWRFGYAAIWVLIAVVFLGLIRWFGRRGWLR